MKMAGTGETSHRGVSSIKLVECSESPHFRKVRYRSPYVDKSLLLKVLFDPSEGELKSQQLLLITAPPSFGKSVNMDMIKCFIEIQVDVNTGIPIPRDSEESNYKLFEGLEIMKDMTFVNRFYGKYPVIKVNFFGTKKKITEVSANKFCKTVIRDAYLAHKYLTLSEHLNDYEKESCEEWCHKKYKNIDSTDTENALKELSKYLYKHHKEEVFMLIDEYDSLPLRAMFTASERDLESIADIPADIIAPAWRYGEHVAGVILTGISYIGGIGLSVSLKIRNPFRFLDMRKLDEYYGLTEKEVDKLLKDFSFTEDEKLSMHEAYNGYVTKNGLKMYNIWSVISHIQAVQAHKAELKTNVIGQGSPVKPKSYWIDSVGIAGIKSIYEFPYLKDILKTCVLDTLILAEIYPKVSKKDLKILRRLIHEDSEPSPKRQKLQCDETFPDSNLFLTFLLEQGCLTYENSTGTLDIEGTSDRKDKKCYVKVPNTEIKVAMMDDLRRQYINLYGINQVNMDHCSILFKEVFSAVNEDEVLKQKLQDLSSTLEQCCNSLKESGTVINHEVLKELLFYPLCTTGYKFQSEVPTGKKRREDFLLCCDDLAIILELKYKTDARDGLKQIVDKEYYSLFQDKYFFSKGVKEYFFMGLNFDSDLKVSMCYLQKKDFDVHKIFLEQNPKQKLTDSKINEIVNSAVIIQSGN